MSIAVITAPQQPTPQANKAIYVVSGSNQASGNYRYVADVKNQAGTVLSRLKCDKVPSNGNGFFNVRDVVKPLIVPTKPNPVAGWQVAAIAARYIVTFMEEYGTPPAVITGVTTNASGLMWAAYFKQQAIPVTSGYLAVSGMNDFLSLTNRPLSYSLKTSQSDFLAIMKNDVAIEFFATVVYQSRQFYVYSASGFISGIFNAGLVNQLTSGQTSDGFPGEAGFPKTRDAAWSYYQARATSGGAVAQTNPCAKAAYDLIVPEMPFGSTYTVQLNVDDPVDTAFSQIYTITVDDCERYPQQVVYFRNQLGGLDSYNFKLKNRTDLTIQRSTFNANTDVYGTASFEKVWQGEYRERLDLNSDWLTDAEWLWLSEMFLTSQLYVLQDGALVEAVVSADSYSLSRRVNDNLQQLALSVQVAYKNTIL